MENTEIMNETVEYVDDIVVTEGKNDLSVGMAVLIGAGLASAIGAGVALAKKVYRKAKARKEQKETDEAKHDFCVEAED